MGGGETFPSATTVRALLDTARTNEAQGKLLESADAYRQASEVVLKIGGGAGLTDDERYCLELQSQEFLQKAMALETQHRNQTQAQLQSQAQAQTQAPQTVHIMQENVGEAQMAQVQVEPVETAQSMDEGGEGGPRERTSDKTGACVVGATGGFCVGSIVGLPLIGTVAGGIFGGVAAARDDEYGERARKFGRYGAAAVDKTAEFNRRYNVVGNLKVGAESLLYKAQEYDKKHNVVGRVANASTQVWNKAVQIEKEHKIGEKVSEAAKATVDGAVKLDEKYKISSKVGDKISQAFTPEQNEPGPKS